MNDLNGLREELDEVRSATIERLCAKHGITAASKDALYSYYAETSAVESAAAAVEYAKTGEAIYNALIA